MSTHQGLYTCNDNRIPKKQKRKGNNNGVAFLNHTGFLFYFFFFKPLTYQLFLVLLLYTLTGQRLGKPHSSTKAKQSYV